MREMLEAKKIIDEENAKIEVSRGVIVEAHRRYAKAHYNFREATQLQLV